MHIIDFLQLNNNLPSDIIALFQSEVQNQTLKKGTQIIETGSRNKNVYFIEEGLTRMYYLKEDKSITHLFSDQHQLFTNIEVIYYDEPSYYNIECLEDCQLNIMNYDRIIELAQTHPILDQITRNLLFESLYRLSNRIRSIQFQSAEDRYKDLLNNYPEILQRTSLGHIASYLGISQSTLSVIRGKI